MTTLDHEAAGTLERLLACDPADSERVLPVDDRQRELTARYIVPILPQLECEFLAIRKTVDAKIRRRLTSADQETKPARDKYPKGFCLPITVEAVSEFESRASGSSEMADAVRAFRAAGGQITKVWGVLRNQYFQNALQFGSIYFDVANDTVDVTKPKVEYMPMEESGFRNIESYAEYAEVAERYWNCAIYPNRHFPQLAPLLPILLVSQEGHLYLQSPVHYMQRMNIESELRASETFLTAGSYSAKSLPEVWLDRIARYKRENLPAAVPTPRSGVAPEELLRVCADYRQRKLYTSRPFLSRVLQSATKLTIESASAAPPRSTRS